MSFFNRRHHRVFGGPEDGTIVGVSWDTTVYQVYNRRDRHAPRYAYVLIDADVTGSVFVPASDDDLIAALEDPASQSDEQRAAALAAEIQRRGLEVFPAA